MLSTTLLNFIEFKPQGRISNGHADNYLFISNLFRYLSCVDEQPSPERTRLGSCRHRPAATTYDMQNVAIEYSISLLHGDRYPASVISVRRGETISLDSPVDIADPQRQTL